MRKGPLCILMVAGCLYAFAPVGVGQAQVYQPQDYRPYIARLPEVQPHASSAGRSETGGSATVVALPNSRSPDHRLPPLRNPLRPLTTATHPLGANSNTMRSASHRYAQAAPGDSSAPSSENTDAAGNEHHLTFPDPHAEVQEGVGARVNRFFFGTLDNVRNFRHRFGSWSADQAEPPAETVYPMEGYAEGTETMMDPGMTPGYGHFAGECGCPRPCGWQAVFGVETTFLVPNREGSLAEVTVATPTDSFSTFANENLHYGPRVWVGAKHGPWGVLGRFWHQNDAGYDFDPIMGGGDRGFTSESGLETYTFDVEITRSYCCSDAWSFDLALGFRYASLEDLAFLSVTSLDTALPPAVVLASATAITEFDGPGITLAFGGSRPVHCFCSSCVKVFWSARGSVMWGDMISNAQTAVTVIDFNAAGFADRIDLAVAQTEDELFIGEIQAGVRWEHELKCAPATAFAQVAFEYQYWDADVGWAQTQSQANVNANSGMAMAVAGPDVEMNLLGFNVGAGLVW